jgi:hypothetical protein
MIGAIELSDLEGNHRDGQGYVTVYTRGVSITLATRKGSQTQSVEINIPRDELPLACTALEAWIAAAGIDPGAPVFRQVVKVGRQGGCRICIGRLKDQATALILRLRVEWR